MEQKIFKYPYYRTSQFLTSEDLNNSFSYVEEQERLTRSKMIGSGIISGLDFDNTINASSKLTKVTVNPGFGVTSDGYSVSFPKAVAYEYMVLYSDYIADSDILNAEKKIYNSFSGIKYLLFTADEIKSKKIIPNSDIVKSINIPQSEFSKYGLALVVDLLRETSFNCNPSDCNINSSYDNIIYRPVLMDLSVLEKINSYYSELNYLKIQKLSHISEIKSVTAFNKATQTLVDVNMNLLENFLKHTTEEVSTLLPHENTQLKNALKIFHKSISGDFMIYYLSSFNDIQAAVNEFVNAYNNFIHKYTFSSASRKDLLLVLGAIPYVQNDIYRYTFTETENNEQYNADKIILAKLYLRIAALFKQFIPGKKLSALIAELIKSNYSFTRKFLENIKIIFENTKVSEIKDVSKCIKIIPCKGFSEKLGNRSIPYYYHILELQRNDSLLQNWHAHDLDSSLDMIYNYYWSDLSKPENYKTEFILNLNDYPFYRIEGHLGLSINKTYDYLSNLVKQLDIPVQLLKVDITNQAWQGFKNNFELFTDKYKLFVEAVNEEIKKQGSDKVLSNIAVNLDKIKQTFTQTSYRDVPNVKKVLDDVNAYCNLIISPEFNSKSYKNAKTAAVGETTTAASSYEFINNYIKEYNIFSLRDDLVGLYTKAEPVNEISLSEIQGLEYLGGVYKGGTFILLHDGEKVIADFSLPYFYSLNKDRIF